MLKKKHSLYKKKKQWSITRKIELNQDKPSAEQTSNTAEMHLAFMDLGSHTFPTQ